jgi:hypothetical protein
LFANFIAFAHQHGHRVVNCTFHTYADFFETTRRDIYCRFPAPRRKSLLDRVPGLAVALRKTRLLYHLTRAASVLNEKFPLPGAAAITLRERNGQDIADLDGPELQSRIGDARMVFVYGWNFRAPQAMRRHSQVVRDYFRPVQHYEDSSQKLAERLRHGAEILLGVHIRQGDYRHWRGGKYYFPVSRYAAWMSEFAQQFPDRRVSFLVCSDEARNQNEFPGLRVTFGTDAPVTDLCALAKCDYIIGPVSSFSQWASFYGNKPLFHLREANAVLELNQFRVSFLDEIPR